MSYQDDHIIAGLRQGRNFIQGLPEDLTQFAIDSKKVDAHLNHGIDSGADKGTYLRFANTIMHRELGQDSGKPISEDDYIHAQKAGSGNVQPSAVVLSKEITNLHHNPDNDNIVMSVRNLVKNPDGSTASYEEPWSDSKGMVKQFPMKVLQDKIKGAGHLADGMSKMEQMTGAHPTRSDLLNVIDTKLNSLNAQSNSD